MSCGSRTPSLRSSQAEHPTREGKVYCCCVLDSFSRRIVGWSNDSVQEANLVVNALDMAIKNRAPTPGGVAHADHETQFTSWAFTNKILSSRIMPSFGSVGDGLDNAMMESFWSSMQIEMVNRKKRKIRVALANAMFDYIGILYNRQLWHSQLGCRTPIQYELTYENQLIPAGDPEPNR